MKKYGILNTEINARIAMLGHTDRITISDAGLPIPDERQRVDVCVAKGIPQLLDVLKAVLNDIEVEQLILAEEIKTVSPEMHKSIIRLIGEIPVIYVPHEQFKQDCALSKSIIRTGEFTPYSSVQLVCGCTF